MMNQRQSALTEGIKEIFKHVMLSDLNTIVFEFLRNWAVSNAIDYCLYRARMI